MALARLASIFGALTFAHTVFALPFAYVGMVLAARGWPGWWPVVWVTMATIGARTCAMAANRVIDREIDAANPRTAGRHVPRGVLRASDLGLVAAAGAGVMVIAAWLLNPACVRLATFALVFLVGYSYTKRFTWTSHWILGFTDGFVAGAGWLAVTGRLEPPALVLWFALTVWIAGFDLIYACQDAEFDRARGLHSVPARFGIRAALTTARLCHGLAAMALGLLGWLTGLGWPYWLGWAGIVGLLAWEHSLVQPEDLSRLDVAFFNVNGYIAVIALAAVIAGLWV